MPNQFQQSQTAHVLINQHTLACWIMLEIDLQTALRRAGRPITQTDRDRMTQYVTMYDAAKRREQSN